MSPPSSILIWRAAACAGALIFLLARPGRAQEPKLPDGYVGSEACQACHEEIAKGFKKNAHSSLESNGKRGWAARACESCHGPGARHSESAEATAILNPAKLAPGSADKSCLGCHKGQATQAGRVQNGHGRQQVACATCHPVHKPAPENGIPGALTLSPAARINRQCAACHQDVWAAFQRPHAHALPQGTMSCIDCHNPHGSFFAKGVRTVSANEPNCFRCHGDKRGPFVFEHAPMRSDGCGACHEPHGSANPRMLTRHEVGFQCLECHSNIATPGGTHTGVLGGIPPAFHDTRSPRFRNCTVCHMKIHGSQVNRGFLR